MLIDEAVKYESSLDVFRLVCGLAGLNDYDDNEYNYSSQSKTKRKLNGGNRYFYERYGYDDAKNGCQRYFEGWIFHADSPSVILLSAGPELTRTEAGRTEWPSIA